MFRSIRWTLQLWHALLLVAVVCAFGGTMYIRLERARMDGVDAELKAQAEVLVAKMRPGFGGGGRPPRDGPGGEPRMTPPPHGENDAGPREPRQRPDGEPGSREPRPRGGERDLPSGPGTDVGPGPTTGPSSPPRRRDFGRGWVPPDFDIHRLDEVERRLEIPGEMLGRFQGDDPGTPYFVIWRSNGEFLRASRANLPIPPHPGVRDAMSPPPAPSFRQRDQWREVVMPGMFGLQVVVGRSIEKERAELRQLLAFLGITAAALIAIGLAGGWFIAGRATRPIRTITATAQNISASNLSRRIDVAETESELGSLAGVLNAMFARLETAFDQQIRFTADASHELRTPLAIMYTQCELSLTRERPAAEYREALEACFRAARRMKALVESLLVLARADAGKLEINQEPLDLAEVAQDCVELLRPVAAQKKVRIDLDAAPAPILGDSFRLAQVITNLLTNAINYNKEPGSVSVAVRIDGGRALLSVADTGVGIAAEDQPHLFERFYRVDKARSRSLGGSGLGLAIARSIVEAHGGVVTFTSTPGEGTTFVVCLPLARSGGPA